MLKVVKPTEHYTGSETEKLVDQDMIFGISVVVQVPEEKLNIYESFWVSIRAGKY